MKKKFLLFDADRTLLDFSASEKSALAKTFAEYNLPFTSEVYQWHLVNNAKLWQDYEKGLIDRKTVLYTRFVRLFDHFGYEGDGAAFEDSYRHNLDNSCDLFPEAMEVVQALSKTHDLYIVTNGVASTQENRLRDSGLAPWFKDIFISEQVGSQKPQKEYFDFVFERLGNPDKKSVLMVGDSLTSDMKGAVAYGIDSCWLNRKGQTTDLPVTYTVTEVSEIFSAIE